MNKIFDNITDLEAFILDNQNTTVFITPELNTLIGKAFCPKNSLASNEQNNLTFQAHNIVDSMFAHKIIIKVK